MDEISEGMARALKMVLFNVVEIVIQMGFSLVQLVESLFKPFKSLGYAGIIAHGQQSSILVWGWHG